MAKAKQLRFPREQIGRWTDEVQRVAAASPVLEIDLSAMAALDLDELGAWRRLAAGLEERGVVLRYRGDPAAALLLRLVAGQRLLGDLQLMLADGEVVLAPGPGLDLERDADGAASGIARHLRGVRVVVDLERVGQVGSNLINWLLQLRQELGVERLPLRGGSTRALAPLRQMGLDHILDLG